MAKSKSKKRGVIRWTKRILLILGALGVIAAIVRALLPDTVAVDTAIVSRGPLEVEIREDGQTRVRDRFVVAAPITGELDRITADAGTWLDRGSTIARISPPTAALLDDRTRSEAVARLAIARARERQALTAITRARSSRELAVTEADRTRTLAAEGAVTGVERDRANLAERLATEELAAAEYQRAAAVSEIDALRAILDPKPAQPITLAVTAPTRGRVLRVLRESAGPVSAGTPLVEVGDPASLEVVVDVLSRDAERVAPGMAVEIETAGTPLRGTVILVEPSAFTRISALGVEEQRVNIIICIEAPPTLGDAFRVDARIITWRGDDVLIVPASALFRDHNRWAVYVFDNKRARLRHVDIGHRGRTTVEVTRGLEEGERVILHPSDQIRDATRVAAR